MIFSAVLTTPHIRPVESTAASTEMQYVRMLSMVPLQNVVRIKGGRWALLIFRRKDMRRCALLCLSSPGNLVLLTTSTVVLFMRSGAWLGWLFLKSTMISFVLASQQLLHLLSVGQVVVVPDETHHCCVIIISQVFKVVSKFKKEHHPKRRKLKIGHEKEVTELN